MIRIPETVNWMLMMDSDFHYDDNYCVDDGHVSGDESDISNDIVNNDGSLDDETE